MAEQHCGKWSEEGEEERGEGRKGEKMERGQKMETQSKTKQNKTKKISLLYITPWEIKSKSPCAVSGQHHEATQKCSHQLTEVHTRPADAPSHLSHTATHGHESCSQWIATFAWKMPSASLLASFRAVFVSICALP